MNLKTLRTALYWSFPSLFCLWLYSRGLRTWFFEDDFAFLGLLPSISSWQDLLQALFEPTVHGTWRPLSDRVYFMLIQAIFGAESAVPFKVVTFLFQFANLVLISAVTLRITKSRLAGFLAPLFWIANSKLVISMTWTCAFDYPACGFCLLLAFWLLLKHIETGSNRYLYWMWAVHLTGYLVLESNIVFPALAIAYSLLFARPFISKVVWIAVPAIVFVLLHQTLIHKQVAGPYAARIDLGMLNVLREYWVFVFLQDNMTVFAHIPARLGTLGMRVFTVALLGFVAWQAYRRNWTPLFFLSWFVIVTGPFLPFQNHLTNYYVTLPSVGLAMLAATAFAAAWANRVWWRAFALVLVAFFFLESVPSARGGTTFYFDRSRILQKFVLGVADAHEKAPEKIIVLSGLDDFLFWGTVYNRSFRPYGVDDAHVYLEPSMQPDIHQEANSGPISEFMIPEAKARAAQRAGKLLVVRFANGKLLDITDGYKIPEGGGPGDSSLDVGDPLLADQVGPTWFPAENGFRWMPKKATVKMRAGRGITKLIVEGHTPPQQVTAGPLGVTFSVNGVTLPKASLSKPDEQFHLEFPIQVPEGSDLEIGIQVDRTFRIAGDERDLGLAFGTFGLK